ncbi:hypothetical protein BDV10DRAFT_172710 [Aspergillus recurvatus]
MDSPHLHQPHQSVTISIPIIFFFSRSLYMEYVPYALWLFRGSQVIMLSAASCRAICPGKLI